MNRKLIVAFCSDKSEFADNYILEPDVARLYPGAYWIIELAESLKALDIRLVTGDVAVRQVNSHNIQPEDILVIQEDVSCDASRLISRGAKAWVTLCLESPLFAADFYQQLPRFSGIYEHCIVFKGVADEAYSGTNFHILFFPSYHWRDYPEIKAWEIRKEIVMVAGNKYWDIKRSGLRRIAARVKDVICRRPRRFSKKYAKLQLHDHRLAAISHLGDKNLLELYGHNWDRLENLPLYWQSRLEHTMDLLKPSPVLNKQSLLTNFKFSLCFENMAFPGYVTEKIFDSVAAGVVPIYLGAPDITQFVPGECFIDARKYSLPELEERLKGLTKAEWLGFIEQGQSFLHSESGFKHSYMGFASQMVSLLPWRHRR